MSVKREATFCHSLSFWWLWHIFDSFMSTFCWVFSMNCNWKTKMRKWGVFFDEWRVFCSTRKNKWQSSARAAFWCYVIASYLSSNRIFKIFNSKWSYDKMLIDWVRSGRMGKYLALGQEVRTSLRLVRTPWPRAKYFPVRPSHSVNKYILF